MYAQRTISGKVTSKEEPSGAPSVTVQVKGTTTGTITDIEGNYKITVPNDQAVLIFSFVGFLPQEVLVGNQSTIDVELKADDKQLQEVVVVGYGAQEKRDVTGSISQIKAGAIQNNSVTSFDAAMQGRAPGLQITQSSGVPGAAAKVRVRGQGAIAGGGDPLYVIDGVILDDSGVDYSNRGGPNNAQNTNPLANINMNDIESIEVLKDASSTAIYGSRGANGVIMITTKKGKAGKTSFNLGYYYGVSQATRKLPMLNGQEWLQLYNEARVNDGRYGRLSDGVKVTENGFPLQPISGEQIIPNTNIKAKDITNTNWIDEVLQTGQVHNFDLSATGGTEKTRFAVTTGYRSEGSMLRPGYFDRFSIRTNIDNQATDKLKFGVQANLNISESLSPPVSFNGGIGSAQSNALPILPVRNPDGTYYGTQFFDVGRNPLAVVNSNKYITSANNLIASVYGEYQITKDIVWRSQISNNTLNQVEDSYFSGVVRYYNGVSNSGADQRKVNISNWLTTHYATYNKQFNDKHSLNVVAGLELQNVTNNFIGYYMANGAVGFADPYFTVANGSNLGFISNATASDRQGNPLVGYSGVTFNRTASVFMRANYKLKDKYLFGFTFRRDGSSRFGQDFLYGNFPSVSAGWILSEESFIKNISAISFLKARASFGFTGSSAIDPYQWLGSYSPVSNAFLGQTGYSPTLLPNRNLSWSDKSMFDAAIDYGFFQGRISGSLAFYLYNSSRVFIARPVPISATGFENFQLNDPTVNIRDMGVEFNVSTKNIVAKQVGGLEWSTDFNISSNSNVVTNTNGIPPDGFGGGQSLPGDTRVVEGYAVGIHYVAKSAGVDPQTGQELIYDLEGKKVVVNQTNQVLYRQPVGSPLPKFFGGISNNLRFKGFDLSILFSFSYGNTVYLDDAKFLVGGQIANWNQRREVLNRWQKPGDVTDVPRLTLNDGGFPGYNTDRWVYDASFLRLRNLQIGYTLPKSIVAKAKMSSARIYVGGQNLLLFTSFPGWDPEAGRYSFSRTDGNLASHAPYLASPQARQLIFGVNIGF
jgi:TonB-dependent starch-binding outer membrane protein SusC